MKKYIPIILECLSFCAVGFAYADSNLSNIASIDTPAGNGYLWCKLEPTANMPVSNFMDRKNLEKMPVYLATSCVNISGATCKNGKPPMLGTALMNMWELKNHYFTYEKSGRANAGYCQPRTTGNVQIRVDYYYKITCYTDEQPPEGLEPINKPAC